MRNVFTVTFSLILLASLFGTAFAGDVSVSPKESMIVEYREKEKTESKDHYEKPSKDRKEGHHAYGCVKDMVKVYKISDNSPACIKLSSVEPLVNQRGWAELRVENFVQCLAAGNSPMESIPRKCEHNDKVFAEGLEAHLTYNEVRVGLLYTKSSNLASLEKHVLEATKFAVEEFNKDNKDKIKLKLEIANTKTALTNVKYFDDLGIKTMLGPSTSMELAAVKDYVNENDMMLISCCSTAQSLAESDSMFRLTSNDVQQAKTMVEAMRADGVDKIITVYRNDTWGIDFNSEIVKHFDKGILDTIAYMPEGYNAQDIAKSISDSLSVAPNDSDGDIGVVIMAFDETEEILKEFGETPDWDKSRWYGTNVNALSPAMIEDELVEIAQGVKFATPHLQYEMNPTLEMVNNRIKDVMGEEPSPYAFPAYDAVHILGNAAIMADGDVAMIAENVPNAVKAYDGATGRFTLNEFGDRAEEPFDTYRVVDGEWSRVDMYQEKIHAQKLVSDVIAKYQDSGSLDNLDDDALTSKELLYLFVIKDNKIVSHGANSTLVGQDITNMLDINGVNIANAITDAATPDGGWAEYMWVNPVTEKIEPKSSWVVTHDGYIFGVGVYR